MELKVVETMVEQGGSALVIGILLFLVWIFYRKQFRSLWENLERKDLELSRLNARVLEAFERNTVAFEKNISLLKTLTTDIGEVKADVKEVKRRVRRIDENTKRH